MLQPSLANVSSTVSYKGICSIKVFWIKDLGFIIIVSMQVFSFACHYGLINPIVLFYSSVDATRETTRLGRLINHSKTGNCQTRLHDIDGKPHLILVASRDIDSEEELLYDYGDRSKAALSAHPWLKH